MRLFSPLITMLVIIFMLCSFMGMLSLFIGAMFDDVRFSILSDGLFIISGLISAFELIKLCI